MPLTKEQLLTPRVKVTADYPDSPFTVGEILQMVHQDGEWGYSKQFSQAWFNKYPLIFQPLPWWSDRKPEEMPEYVKHDHGWVRKHIGVNHSGDCFTFIGRNDIIEWKFQWFQPATEEEYIEYINKKQQ